MSELRKIKLAGKEYEVLDVLNNVTLADSFVKNKTGVGHGEAKLYVGNEGERYFGFFDDLKRTFFFLKSDFKKYLLDARDEFLHPEQDYVKKAQMPEIYSELNQEVDNVTAETMTFSMYRKDVNPPRVYLQSDSEYYELMRSVGLPNISYVSFLKIRDKRGVVYYYCRIFVNYRADIARYESPDIQKVEQELKIDSELARKKLVALQQSRVGQGEYRRKLIEECQYCPFTMVNDERLLIASHIKPWVRSNDREKIDPKNGFALTPTYDKLFDAGFITFNDDKTVTVSPWISPMNQKYLRIFDGMKLSRLQLDEKRSSYLLFHREEVFKG